MAARKRVGLLSEVANDAKAAFNTAGSMLAGVIQHGVRIGQKSVHVQNLTMGIYMILASFMFMAILFQKSGHEQMSKWEYEDLLISYWVCGSLIFISLLFRWKCYLMAERSIKSGENDPSVDDTVTFFSHALSVKALRTKAIGVRLLMESVWLVLQTTFIIQDLEDGWDDDVAWLYSPTWIAGLAAGFFFFIESSWRAWYAGFERAEKLLEDVPMDVLEASTGNLSAITSKYTKRSNVA